MNGCFLYLFVAFIAMVLMRLTGFVGWSWTIVTAPLWASAMVWLLARIVRFLRLCWMSPQERATERFYDDLDKLNKG